MTHYIVVRRDLPLGLLAAEVAHAAGESSPGNLPAGTNVVVLGVLPEALQAAADRLIQAGLRPRLIHESDSPYEGQLMAVGVPPCPRELVRPYVSSLPLLRELSSEVGETLSPTEAEPVHPTEAEPVHDRERVRMGP